VPEPTTPLPDDARSFLAEPRYATIATLDEDGAPHQAVVWYAVEGDDLVINSRRERRWPRNLLRDGRIAVAVFEAERPFHWLGLKGRAELLHEGEDAMADIMALARRYGRDPQQYAGQDRISFRVRIESTFEYGR
jgi:PPOX class probable F420-dependent enzyme